MFVPVYVINSFVESINWFSLWTCILFDAALYSAIGLILLIHRFVTFNPKVWPE